MLISIEICDVGEGGADVTAKFDPDLSEETRHTPAVKCFASMMAALSTNITSVETGATKDENQFEMFEEAQDDIHTSTPE